MKLNKDQIIAINDMIEKQETMDAIMAVCITAT